MFFLVLDMYGCVVIVVFVFGLVVGVLVVLVVAVVCVRVIVGLLMLVDFASLSHEYI